MKSISFSSLRELKRNDGGLSEAEVNSQRSRFGLNEIVEVAGNPWLDLAGETIKDPMIWFLIAVGSVFYFTGEWADAITLFIAVLPLMLMDAFLHWRTQASTASLKSQLSSRVKVLRNAQEIEVDSRELVPGDMVVLRPGVLLPADGIFESAKEIKIDESVLTGEAFPIEKSQTTLDPFALSAKDELKVMAQTLGYAGTKVLTGHGFLRVLLTGARTAYGEIVQSVSRMPHERTPLQKSIARLVQVLIFSALALCLLLAIVRVYQGHGWLDAVLSAATLAVAAIPEEFPVVFTFYLGVGIYRLAKKLELVRRAVSVENIGRVTQICTDKTGTITLGKLTLSHFDLGRGVSTESMLDTALVASSTTEDPMDIAIQEVADEKKISSNVRVQTLPFTEDRKRETGFFKTPDGRTFACMKGAPETLFQMSSLTPDEKESWRERVSQWAKSGHKVIACAKKEVATSASFEEPQSDLEIVGLLIFEDPARPEVAAAMEYCRESGIRVLMITGDHPDTAAAIARDSRLTTDTPRVVSADDESDKFEEEWLNQNPGFLKSLDVVARCTPLQKLRIVTALKQSGELVAVTGDGVNDVPALKAADIGIAMGERGTRSAREVSSIILADDNFSTIVNAIREGRQLFKNLAMSFEYLLLIHIPLVLTAAIVPLMGYPLVYLPVHIVWLELIIHPTALLAFQTAAPANRERVASRSSFFSKSKLIAICVAGFLFSGLLALGFLLALNGDVDQARGKAMALLTLWSAGIVLGLTRFHSQVANALAMATIASSVILIQLSGELEFLHLRPLHLHDWIEVGALVILVSAGIWLLSLWRKMCR